MATKELKETQFAMQVFDDLNVVQPVQQVDFDPLMVATWFVEIDEEITVLATMPTLGKTGITHAMSTTEIWRVGQDWYLRECGTAISEENVKALMDGRKVVVRQFDDASLIAPKSDAVNTLLSPQAPQIVRVAIHDHHTLVSISESQASRIAKARFDIERMQRKSGVQLSPIVGLGAFDKNVLMFNLEGKYTVSPTAEQIVEMCEKYILTNFQIKAIGFNPYLIEEKEQGADIVRMNMRNMGITDFPSRSALQGVTHLDLSHNEIAQIPAWISELHSLKNLNLMGNKLTKLPSEIWNVFDLSRLNVSENLLTELPENICEALFLKSLFIGDNQITHLPNNIMRLRHLKVLGAYSNEITHLPEERWAWANRVHANFATNKFPKNYTIPDSWAGARI